MSESKYTVARREGFFHIVGPGVSAMQMFDESLEDNGYSEAVVTSIRLGEAYAAGVEAGRAEAKPTVTTHNYYHIDALEARITKLEETVKAFQSTDDTDWPRRARIAEAQVEAVHHLCRCSINGGVFTEYDRGVVYLAERVIDESNAAREKASKE